MKFQNNFMQQGGKKRNNKEYKKINAYSYFYKGPRKSSYFWNIYCEVFKTEGPRTEWAIALDFIVPQHSRTPPSPLESG